MADNRIDKRFGGVCFAQLLGMQAMMSTQLALQHYKVKKYVPFGPTSKLLPYLTRRAAESHEVVTKIEEQISQVMTELRLRSE
jgi:proline dehydrogenase